MPMDIPDIENARFMSTDELTLYVHNSVAYKDNQEEHPFSSVLAAFEEFANDNAANYKTPTPKFLTVTELSGYIRFIEDLGLADYHLKEGQLSPASTKILDAAKFFHDFPNIYTHGNIKNEFNKTRLEYLTKLLEKIIPAKEFFGSLLNDKQLETIVLETRVQLPQDAVVSASPYVNVKRKLVNALLTLKAEHHSLYMARPIPRVVYSDEFLDRLNQIGTKEKEGAHLRKHAKRLDMLYKGISKLTAELEEGSRIKLNYKLLGLDQQLKTQIDNQ